MCAEALSKRFTKQASLRPLDIEHPSMIKGNLAERICQEHFSTLGYSVDRLGVEKFAPNYLSAFSEHGEGYYLESSFSSIMRRLPDFLISYRYIDGPHKGRRDAVFVDAKFRSSFDFDSTTATATMIRAYHPLLALGAPVMLYLVTPKPRGKVAGPESHVYLNFCRFAQGQLKYENWYAATDEKLDGWPFYKVPHPKLFSKATRDIIEPRMRDEFKAIAGL